VLVSDEPYAVREGIGRHCTSLCSIVFSLQPDIARLQCLAPTYSGEYYLKGSELRKRGMNRIGNMVVPNGNYCKFEDWIMPILDTMLLEQQRDGTVWTPSKVPPPPSHHLTTRSP